MSDKPRLDVALKVARANRHLQQFGQGNDDEVHDGKTACTHTMCQFLALLWKDRVLTLNQVNRLAGMPKNARNEDTKKPRGMRPPELATFFDAVDIPMILKFGREFERILANSDRGPVMYGMRYGSAPRREGFEPTENGFARPRTRGATQRGVPDIRHAVLLLGYLERRSPQGRLLAINVFRKEPNHGSGVRPERPPYDQIFGRQARREYEDYRDRLGNSLYAAIPRRDARSPSVLPDDERGGAGLSVPTPAESGPADEELDDDLDDLGDEDEPVEPGEADDDEDMESDPIPDSMKTGANDETPDD
jgi:hypothetical protein